MGKKTIRHLDFETLADINRQVVQLTEESHSYSEPDGQKLRELVVEVENRADNQGSKEAIPDKAALLIFKLASGQYFHAGNKRTALVAGLVFLRKNGLSFSLENEELVATVDKAGMAAAGLDDLLDVIQRVAEKHAVERKGWDKAVAAIVETNKDALTHLGA